TAILRPADARQFQMPERAAGVVEDVQPPALLHAVIRNRVLDGRSDARRRAGLRRDATRQWAVIQLVEGHLPDEHLSGAGLAEAERQASPPPRALKRETERAPAERPSADVMNVLGQRLASLRCCDGQFDPPAGAEEVIAPAPGQDSVAPRGQLLRR